jgi:hypothetical protein
MRDNSREVPKANTQEKFSRSMLIFPGRSLKFSPRRLNTKIKTPIKRNVTPRIMKILERMDRDIVSDKI